MGKVFIKAKQQFFKPGEAQMYFTKSITYSKIGFDVLVKHVSADSGMSEAACEGAIRSMVTPSTSSSSALSRWESAQKHRSLPTRQAQSRFAAAVCSTTLRQSSRTKSRTPSSTVLLSCPKAPSRPPRGEENEK